MYRVGVIGLGSIAERYGRPQDRTSYCHVGGILHSERVELAAVADLDEQRRANFRKKWGDRFPGTKYYAGHHEMLAEEALDIVAVCVRGPAHFAVTGDVIEAAPRAIFLEKPPSMSLSEMDTMAAAARNKGIPITVSYSRHWSPHVLRLEQLVKDGLIGEVRTVVGFCGGAFLSFASHVTDLICQFAGYRARTVFARGRPGKEAPDGYEPEPDIAGAIIEFDGGVTGIHVGQPGAFGGFYADVHGSEGYVRAGIYTPAFARDKEGNEIDLASQAMPADASVFTVAYGQIADHLDGGPPPACTGDDWIAVNEIGFAGIESVHTGQPVALPNTNRARRVFANG